VAQGPAAGVELLLHVRAQRPGLDTGIADIIRGMDVVRPGGTVRLRPLPSTSTGPSLREMSWGSPPP
jgi:hypothetical protein